MKAKKALKRLNKVETILSNVIDQCPASARGLRELLDSARASVVRAKGAVNARAARAARKPPAKALESARGHLSTEGRERISRAMKKRWAAAKRKGMNVVTGRPLSATAIWPGS
jgi:hypothetical protein